MIAMAKKPSRDPRPTEWADSLGHLDYEVEMLAGAALEAFKDETRSWAVRNALVESITIHMRNLADFLERYHLKGDDVFPEDFHPRRTWQPVAVLSAGERARINKEVAHLTYGRKHDGDPTKRWDPSTIVCVLRVAATYFNELGRPLPPSAQAFLARA